MVECKVYCNDDNCLHWQQLKEKHQIEYHVGIVPFEESGFTGICTRDEIGVEPQTINTPTARYKCMVCKTRSDKKIAGHRDFTKMTPVSLNEDDMKEYNRQKARGKLY